MVPREHHARKALLVVRCSSLAGEGGVRFAQAPRRRGVECGFDSFRRSPVFAGHRPARLLTERTEQGANGGRDSGGLNPRARGRTAPRPASSFCSLSCSRSPSRSYPMPEMGECRFCRRRPFPAVCCLRLPSPSYTVARIPLSALSATVQEPWTAENAEEGRATAGHGSHGFARSGNGRSQTGCGAGTRGVGADGWERPSWAEPLHLPGGKREHSPGIHPWVGGHIP